MAVTFQANGAIGMNNTTASWNALSPTCADNDILIAHIHSKNNQVVTPPAGWALIIEGNASGGTVRTSAFWKRAVASSDSATTFAFTKPIDDNLLQMSVISAWRGCVLTGSPLAGTATFASPASAQDDIPFADFAPGVPCVVVALGGYNTNATTPADVTGTNPTFGLRYDLESSSSTSGSMFGSSGASDGAATGARTQASNSTTNANNMGILLGLLAAGQPPRTIHQFRQRR